MRRRRRRTTTTRCGVGGHLRDYESGPIHLDHGIVAANANTVPAIVSRRSVGSRCCVGVVYVLKVSTIQVYCRLLLLCCFTFSFNQVVAYRLSNFLAPFIPWYIHLSESVNSRFCFVDSQSSEVQKDAQTADHGVPAVAENQSHLNGCSNDRLKPNAVEFVEEP